MSRPATRCVTGTRLARREPRRPGMQPELLADCVQGRWYMPNSAQPHHSMATGEGTSLRVVPRCAVRPQIKGISKKGKEFFKFNTQITETIKKVDLPPAAARWGRRETEGALGAPSARGPAGRARGPPPLWQASLVRNAHTHTHTHTLSIRVTHPAAGGRVRQVHLVQRRVCAQPVCRGQGQGLLPVPRPHQRRRGEARRTGPGLALLGRHHSPRGKGRPCLGHVLRSLNRPPCVSSGPVFTPCRSCRC